MVPVPGGLRLYVLVAHGASVLWKCVYKRHSVFLVMMFADAHSDLGILVYMSDIGEVPRALVDDFFHQMEEGRVCLSVVQVGGDFSESGYDFGNPFVVQQSMDATHRELNERQSFLEVAVSGRDVKRIIGQERSAVILSIEGSAAFGSDFETLDMLHEQGLRNMAITHDGQNQFGCGCRVEHDTGLTPEGETLLDYAASKGIILDLVHVGEVTFWGAIDHSSQPVFVSHSNSKSVYEHCRNLTDEQIVAIGDRGGIVSVNFISEFLAPGPDVAPLDRLVDHIDHIVELIGCENVALGPDFYRYMMPDLSYVGDVNGPSDLPAVRASLEARGYSVRDIARICHENLVRFISASLG